MKGDQGGRVGALHRLRLDLAPALSNASDGLLADRAPSGVELFGRVLVAFLSADVGLIDFDHVAQRELPPATRLAYAVQHMPCRPILHAKLFGELQGADALACGQNRVDGVNPVLEVGFRRVHDGAGGDGEGLAAILVPVGVGLAGWAREVVHAATVRAGDLAAPPDFLKPSAAGRVVGEAPVELRNADGGGDALAARVVRLAFAVVLDYRHVRALPDCLQIIVSQARSTCKDFLRILLHNSH